MNSDRSDDARIMEFFEALNLGNGDGMRTLLQNILNVVMKGQVRKVV